VTPIAGTTRDVVRQTIQIEGVPLHVIDTAGLREGAEEVEQIGIERAWGQIEKADAVVFLHDLTRADAPEYQAADAAIQVKLPGDVPVVDVWNKADAVEAGVRFAHRQPTKTDTPGIRRLAVSAANPSYSTSARHSFDNCPPRHIFSVASVAGSSSCRIKGSSAVDCTSASIT